MAPSSCLVIAFLTLTTAAEDGQCDGSQRTCFKLAEDTSQIQLGPNIEDEYNHSLACYDQAVSHAYSGPPVAILKRLMRLEVAMRDKGCLTQLLDVIPPPPQPRGQTPDAPIGPPDFVEQLWKRLEQTPKLLQSQPVGATADPQRILNLMRACNQYDEEDDAEHYHGEQQWDFCTLLWLDDEEPAETRMIPHLRESALGQLLNPLLDAGVLSKIQFSIIGPQTLVEWHADLIFDLLNADGLNCSASPTEAFSMLRNPWHEGNLETLRIHIPVSNQGTTHFFISGSAVLMSAGEMVALDYYQPHSLYNFGTEARVNLLINFNLTALHDEPVMRKILASRIGQQIVASILRLGYHDPELNQAREDLEKMLYEHQRHQCNGHTGFLKHEDDYHRLLQERKWVPLLQQTQSV